MKKFLPLFFVLAIFSFSACGPTEEEKAKMEQEAGEAVDSLMQQLESEIGIGTENAAENNSEEPTQTTESEEAPKQ